MKAIFAKDVKVKDVILVGIDDQRTVEFLAEGPIPGRNMVIHSVGHTIVLHAGTIVGLVHRPWTEGKTDYEMLEPVIGAAQRPGQFGPLRIAELRRVLDAYELGMPLEDEKPPAEESYSGPSCGERF